MGSRGISAIQNVSYDFSRDSSDATKERVRVKRGKSQLPSRSVGHTNVKVIPKKGIPPGVHHTTRPCPHQSDLVYPFTNGLVGARFNSVAPAVLIIYVPRDGMDPNFEEQMATGNVSIRVLFCGYNSVRFLERLFNQATFLS